MTQAIEWGAEIATNGVKPEWLRDGDETQWIDDNDLGPYGTKGWSYWESGENSTAGKMNWDGIKAIRLPASHPYYLATSQGFEYWPGGGEAPSDWDGGVVLFGDGSVGHADGGTTRTDSACWDRSLGGPDEVDIIGYKKKDNTASDIEDWAIEAATSNFNGKLSVKTVRDNPVMYSLILELARMIQQYEPHRKPVDPDVLAVREILGEHYRVSGSHNEAYYRDGTEDGNPDFQAALAAFKKHKGPAA